MIQDNRLEISSAIAWLAGLVNTILFQVL